MGGSLKEPVFIVGLPRTGSKLLMNVINNNEKANCSIANEMQFFGHSFLGRVLQGRRGVMPIIGSERDSSGAIDWERVVDRLYSGEAKGVYWNGLANGWLGIPRERLLEALSATDGSARQVYGAVLRTQPGGADRFGDKSCPNLFHVDKIYSCFPDAKVIQIIRDPRAILASQHRRLTSKVEYNSGSPGIVTRLKQFLLSPVIVLYILTSWGYAARVDRKYRRTEPGNYLLVRYESLIVEPEATTREICEFLGVPWDQHMIAPPKRDSSFIDPSDVHKTVERGTGMDVEAIERWRQHLRPWMKWALSAYAAVFYPGEMRRLGYVDN